MKFFADLHIHSYFSRATSKQLNLEHLSKWAQLKGIQVVGTGDLVHPGWLDELQEKLQPAEEGFFRLKPEYDALAQEEVPAACRGPVRFVLAGEISNIYKKMDRVRKVHNVVFAPHFDAARRIQARLEAIGNIRSDGRPILGLDSRDLLEITLEADPLAFLVPAHIWTPWFSALGSKGGFDRMEDCFGDLTPHVFAVETGLSSDPPMNWRLSQLDPFVLVSNSDAHSPQKLGREATIFDTDFDYPALYRALADRSDGGLVGTIEFFPEEGKYHYDGHRKCGIRLHPRETRANKGLCPVCGKPVTVGVMARVEELADRPEGEKPPRWRPYFSLIPLPEIIAEARNTGVATQAVQTLFHRMLTRLGNELTILLDVPLEDIERVAGSVIAEGIRRMRAGEITIAPGYDGEYGVIRIFGEQEREEILRQVTFFPDAENFATGQPAGIESPEAPVELPNEPLEEEGASSTASTVAEARMVYAPDVSGIRVENVTLGTHLPEDLNAAQWRVVTHTGGHLLVVAGPGTGKTHTLVQRIAHLVQCMAAPEEVLAITFTNKAAEEMRERLQRQLGPIADRLTIGTFHSFCLQLLRRFGSVLGLPEQFRVAAPEEVEALLKERYPEIGARERRAILDRVSACKARVSPAAGDERMPVEVEQVNAMLRAQHLLDYDDLLREALRLFRTQDGTGERLRRLYRYIFVDEYQDINAVQHALLRALVQGGAQITAIGDPNQAIYGFRGSDVAFFLRFQDDFPGATVLSLSENYRSAPTLVLASQQVIEKAAMTAGVPPLTARLYLDGGLTVNEAATERAEAEYVVHQIEKLLGGTSMFSQDSGRVASEAEAERSFGDIAILYRTNALRPPLEEALSRHGIPYQISGDLPLIEKPAARPILCALRLAHGEAVPVAETAAMLELAGAGLGKKAIERFRKLAGEAVTLSRPQVISLLEHLASQMPALKSSALQAGRGLVELSDRLQRAGLVAALQHMMLLPGWKEALRATAAREQTWTRFLQLARLHSAMQAFVDAVLLQREYDVWNSRSEHVSLMTLHAAKGLEFPVVFIVGCNDGVLPLTWHRDDVDVEEERRLFYVGMTRARQHLFLVHARQRTLFGQTRKTPPSPFLQDIEERLKRYEKLMERRRRPARHGSEQLDLFET